VCGAPVRGERLSLDFVLHDGARVPITDSLTIGRAPGNTIRLSDGTVSRNHARVIAGPDGTVRVGDAGSSGGTFVDGRRVVAPTPIRDGSKIRLGDASLRVERRRDSSEAGRTIIVPAGASLVVDAVGSALASPVPAAPLRPRIRSGWALKRLEESEGEHRFVLRDLRRGGFVRMAEDDAALFDLLDGTRTLPDLIAAAEQRGGAVGRTRLARLLADLGERGLLEDVDGTAAGTGPAQSSRLATMLRPREFPIRGVGSLFERVYRGGGWILFTRPAQVFLAGVALGGIGAFIFLVAARYGTPFVVAGRVGIGGLVFLAGRFLVVAAHELAHGLTLASFGRRVSHAGFKLLLVFPYAFVDTSEGWFEPRGRRLAISAAGPVSDVIVGGGFAVAALAAGGGTVRDVLFNVALAAYVGCFFNLNPALERDGYHILVDLLREPGVRRRSREWLVQRLGGARAAEPTSRALRIYAFATVLWSFSGVVFAFVLTRRYYAVLASLVPRPLVLAGFAAMYLFALLPAAMLVGWPLAKRLRRTERRVPDAAA
jgi:putative peptide zinc metalloprotease protein